MYPPSSLPSRLTDAVEDYAIFMLDPDGTIVSWNLGAQRIKGYAASEIIGQHFSRFYPTSDNVAGKPLCELAEAAGCGRCRDEGWRLRKDGSAFWANVVITAIRDEQGRLVGFTKVTRDDTEVHRHTAALCPGSAAAMFGDGARQLQLIGDLAGVLHKIVDLAVDDLDGCESAGLTMIVKHRIELAASSSEMASSADRIQQQLGEGPALEALNMQQIVLAGDLPTEQRWPAFARRAHAEAGVTSVLSIRLHAASKTFGTLDLYSTRRDAFDEISIELATIFATHATAAISAACRIEQLERKAETRELIGRAKGILMNQQHITADAAFDVLRRVSQQLNMKVTEVADRLELTGDLPTEHRHN